MDVEKAPVHTLSTVEDAEEIIRKVKPVIDGEGWRLLCVAWEEQILMRKTTVILSPLGEAANALYAQEYMKGEIAGIQAMIRFAGALLDAAMEMKKEFDAKVAEKDNEDAISID